MPLGFRFHPGGMADNRPTFQRWVADHQEPSVPKARLKSRARSVVPSGLSTLLHKYADVFLLHLVISSRGLTRPLVAALAGEAASAVGCGVEFKLRQRWAATAPAPKQIARATLLPLFRVSVER